VEGIIINSFNILSQEIPDIDHKCAGHRLHVHPLSPPCISVCLTCSLQTSNTVLGRNSDHARVRVRDDAHGAFRLRARRIVMTDGHLCHYYPRTDATAVMLQPAGRTTTRLKSAKAPNKLSSLNLN
jgi:hypothetical protein